ncbi:MAG: hypothetical protein H6551_01205 [Chitinophagales bacterium]|nr:hypothetical protein [Chitinophagaceae bacterium]MCB9063742.1 hypothetical protein [Chitinophagales bacterium]
MNKKYFLYITLLISLISCKKSNENASLDNGLFDRPYCNDPEAVNYNRDFPGIPDSTVCYYPIDVFVGSYMMKDSIFNAEYELDTVLEYTITLKSSNKTNLSVTGFCTGGESLRFTADKYNKAVADSTYLADSTKLPGQLTCSKQDTLTGLLLRNLPDSSLIKIDWLILSDTGLNYHIGTGTKIK